MQYRKTSVASSQGNQQGSRSKWRLTPVLRLGVMLVFSSLAVHLGDRYSALQADQRRGPYEVIKVHQAVYVTLIDVELHQIPSYPELKQWGDHIKRTRSPHRPVLIHFYQGTRSEENTLGNYQDGEIFLNKLYAE